MQIFKYKYYFLRYFRHPVLKKIWFIDLAIGTILYMIPIKFAITHCSSVFSYLHIKQGTQT